MPGKVKIINKISASKFVLETDAPETVKDLALTVREISGNGVI